MPPLNVIIVTNGKGPFVHECIHAWVNIGKFSLGNDLFVCGPRDTLLGLNIPSKAIIDFADEPAVGRNFHINAKKLAACNAVSSEYVYLVHDRFLPLSCFRNVVEAKLASRDIDFGAVDVFNLDNTLALGELRLVKQCIHLPLQDALACRGRLIATADDARASDRAAVNGGQFFLRRSLIHHLARPLRWGEMEDDVLSHDLRFGKGCWIRETALVTLAPRIAPAVDRTIGTRARYRVYSLACNSIAIVCRAATHNRSIRSVGEQTTLPEIDKFIAEGMVLIDPLHKTFASDYLASTLEKMTVRARLRSEGVAWTTVVRTWYGWDLH